MAVQEFQHIEAILKEWYEDAIVNQIYVKSPIWSQIKKTSRGVGGKRVYIPLRHTLSEAVGGLVANEYTLPTASRIEYTHSYIYQKRNYGRVQVDGLAIAASKAGKGGWIDAFAGETRGIAEAFAIDIDQQCMGRGTGILGHATGDHSSTTQDVDSPHGIDEDPSFMWFRKGMAIQYWDADGFVFDPLSSASAITISAIDPANNEITLSAEPTITPTTSDWIVRYRTASFDGSGNNTPETQSAGNGVIMGIDRIVDDDQTDTPGDDYDLFQGINGNSDTNNWWRAKKQSTRGILTETKIQEDLDAIEQNTDGDTPNLALTTYAIRNKLIEIVKSDRMINTLNLVGGWEAIKYRGGSVSLPIMVHKFCPTGYIYYLNLKYLRFYTLKKLTWDSSMGGIIKQKADEDQFEAWFKMYGNLATDKRNALGKGVGYTTS